MAKQTLLVPGVSDEELKVLSAQNQNTILDWASYYLKLGYGPIAVRQWDWSGNFNGKAPIGEAWNKVAISDTFDNIAKAHRSQTINLGILTGSEHGLIVLDIDVKDNGLTWFLANIWPRLQPELINPMMIRTGSGGYHIYFKPTDYCSSLKSTNKIIKINGEEIGIDLKFDGAQVVAPPSLHKCGGIYSNYYNNFVPCHQLQEIPNWLVDLLRPKPVSLTQSPIADLVLSTRTEHSRDSDGTIMLSDLRNLVMVTLAPYRADNRDQWTRVIFAIARLTNKSQEGYQLALDFSARSPKWSHETSAKQLGRLWRDAHNGGCGLPTLLKMAYADTGDDKFSPTTGNKATKTIQEVQRAHSGADEVAVDETKSTWKDRDWITAVISQLAGNVKCAGDQIWLQWHDDNAVWHPNKYFIDTLVLNVLTDLGANSRHCSFTYVNTMIKFLLSELYDPQFFEVNIELDDWLPIQQGLMLNTVTEQTRPRNKSDRITTPLPILPPWTCSQSDLERVDKLFRDIAYDQSEDFLPWFLGLILYSLRGYFDDSVANLIVLYGETMDGKSTVIETIAYALDYLSVPLGKQIFYDRDETVRNHAGHLVALIGKRVGTFSELGDAKINAATLKRITGADTFTARSAYARDESKICSRAKIWVATNQIMNVGNDPALLRRCAFIEFKARFTDKPVLPHEKALDATLKPWLKSPVGVTAFVTYVIRNAAKSKVATPQSVTKFNELIASMKRDYLEEFATTYLCTDTTKLTPHSDIVKAYVSWCEYEKIKPVNDTTLGMWLHKRYRWKKVNGKRGYELAINKPIL